MCQAAGFKTLEASALLELSVLLCADSCSVQQARQGFHAADDALKLFQQEGDDHGSGMALQVAAGALFAAGEEAGAEFGTWQKKADEALLLFRQLGSKRLEASQLLCISKLHLADGNAKAALSPAKEALVEFRNLGAKDVEALQCLVEAHVQLGEAAQAVEAVKESLERRPGESDLEAQATMLELLMSSLAAIPGKEEEAAACTKEAVRIFQQQGQDSSACRVLLATSAMHRKRRQFDKAINIAQDALSAAQKSERPSKDDIASALQSYSDACLAAGKTEKVLKVAEGLLSSSQHAGDQASQAAAFLASASCYLESRDFSACAEAARSAQVSAEQAGLGLVQAKALLLQAKSGLARGKSKAALLSAQRAQRLFKQAFDRPGEVEAMVEVGRAEVLQLQTGIREPTQTAWESVARGLQTARNLAKALSDTELTAAVLRLMATVQTALGELEDASKLTQEAAQLDNQLGSPSEPLIQPSAGVAVFNGRGPAAARDTTRLSLVPADGESQEPAALDDGEFQKGPSQLIRAAGGELVDARSGLVFEVADRLDSSGHPRQILTRYRRSLGRTVPVSGAGPANLEYFATC